MTGTCQNSAMQPKRSRFLDNVAKLAIRLLSSITSASVARTSLRDADATLLDDEIGLQRARRLDRLQDGDNP